MNSDDIKNPYISVVIPAYNESNRIGATLLSLDCYFKTKNYSYEIIVVNDGSPDATAEVVLSYKSKIKNLTLIDNKINQGKGHAVQTGMLQARGNYRLFMDADNSVDISHLDEFLPYVENQGYDVAIASINLGNSTITDKTGLHRRIFSKLSKMLIQTFATPGISDTQRGFKLFTASAAEKIFTRQTILRFGFDIELIVIARNSKCKIKEIPVVWINAAGSTVTLFSYIETLRELSKITFNRLVKKYN